MSSPFWFECSLASSFLFFFLEQLTLLLYFPSFLLKFVGLFFLDFFVFIFLKADGMMGVPCICVSVPFYYAKPVFLGHSSPFPFSSFHFLFVFCFGFRLQINVNFLRPPFQWPNPSSYISTPWTLFSWFLIWYLPQISFTKNNKQNYYYYFFFSNGFQWSFGFGSQWVARECYKAKGPFCFMVLVSIIFLPLIFLR